MATNSLRLMSVLRVFIIAATISACNGDGGDNLQDPPVVSAVAVSAPTSTIQVDQTLQLTASATDPAGAPLNDVPFEWTTDDAAVATVTRTGLVTGIAAGQTEVRASIDGVSGSTSIIVVSATSPPPPPNPPPDPASVHLQEVAAGLSFPVALTSPAGDDRLFVVEKGGAVRIVKNGALLATPFLDLAGQLSTEREEGLLGLAFAPDYASSRRFFVHYTHVSGDIHVSRFQASSDPDRADPASETVLLTIDHPGSSHNGGQVLFGPDGFLYIAVGDGGSRDGNDSGRGQSLSDLLGNILRIDVASGEPYISPPDNPFVTTAGARPEIWSYGLRNPWRFSFDRLTGDLYIADVGEQRWEEVNVSAASEGAGRGANYGWSTVEGTDCMHEEGCDQAGLVPPVHKYDHDSGCSITGGYVYRGNGVPALQGQYVYADFCEGWVRSFRFEGGSAVDDREWPALRPGRGITSVGEDAQGELYLLTEDGRVLKIVSQ